MNAPLPLPELLTVREAAALLRISSSLVYALCARRSLPHVRIASKLLFRRASLEAYLLEREVPVGAP